MPQLPIPRSAGRVCRASLLAVGLAVLMATATPLAQRGGTLTPEQQQARWDAEKELESLAVIDRKVMMPMRDGIRLATDVYRPRNATGKVPTIWVRTPYNFNYWDVRNGVPSDMTAALTAVQHGYAYVVQNERGHFFSEGNDDILGAPTTDGDDALKRMNSQGFAPGVGRVAPYFEQGNWYRGGAVQMLFITWFYGEQNQVRPMFPPNTSQEDLIRASKSFDLAQQLPPVDWSKAFRHLPVMDLIKAVDGPNGIFADSMPGIATGGAMIRRTPNDSAWYRGGLWHENMKINVPGLYFMSWYDVSVGPNLAEYNTVRKTADPGIRDQQYAVIAPTLHCSYKRATAQTIVGERDMGDARYDYDALTWAWFDHFLKGEANGLLDTMPKVRYYTMGLNKWQTSDSWPPRGAEQMTFFLGSNGRATTLNGDGVLTTKAPSKDLPDSFSYDPKNPVPSHGGNVCCQGNALQGGALDQREVEQRPDVLVYTSEPLKEGIELSGPIDVTVYLSSDRKDTDVTAKVLDVYPDGRAYNLDETIQRVRYREGYDKPPQFMEPGKVYKVALQPMTTSNWFAPGHRIRIEVSSSNFPRFDRNLNTGGNNYDETTGLVARNVIHHSKKYPSSITITVVKRPPAAD